MDRGMYQKRIRIPAVQTLHRVLTSVGRAIVGDPEDPPRRLVWRLAHDQIDQIVKTVNPCATAAQSEDPGLSNIPGCHVVQSSLPFVFVLDTAVAAGGRGGCGRNAMARLNTGLFVGAKHEVSVTQRLTVPNAMIQIQDFAGFMFKLRVPRPYPASVTPGPNGILAQPSPDGGSADGGRDAAADRLAGNFIAGQPRKRQSQISGQLTGQCLYFHHDFRGEKARGARAVAALADRPNAFRRSAFATSIRSVEATGAAHRSAGSTGRQRPRG